MKMSDSGNAGFTKALGHRDGGRGDVAGVTPVLISISSL